MKIIITTLMLLTLCGCVVYPNHYYVSDPTVDFIVVERGHERDHFEHRDDRHEHEGRR